MKTPPQRFIPSKSGLVTSVAFCHFCHFCLPCQIYLTLGLITPHILWKLFYYNIEMAQLNRKHISTIYRCANTERKHVRVRCVSCLIRDFKASVPQVKPHSVIWDQNWNQFILKPQRESWRKLENFFVLFFTCTFYFCCACSIGREISLTGCLRISFSSDADRHADLSGSPLKSKSTRKPLACIIGYLGGYFLIEEKLGEQYLYLITGYSKLIYL